MLISNGFNCWRIANFFFPRCSAWEVRSGRRNEKRTENRAERRPGAWGYRNSNGRTTPCATLRFQRNKNDPSVIVFSEIKRCQNPYSTHNFQKAKSAKRAQGLQGQRERSVKIKLKIKKTYFENKNNTILKIKDLAAKIK